MFNSSSSGVFFSKVGVYSTAKSKQTLSPNYKGFEKIDTLESVRTGGQMESDFDRIGTGKFRDCYIKDEHMNKWIAEAWANCPSARRLMIKHDFSDSVGKAVAQMCKLHSYLKLNRKSFPNYKFTSLWYNFITRKSEWMNLIDKLEYIYNIMSLTNETIPQLAKTLLNLDKKGNIDLVNNPIVNKEYLQASYDREQAACEGKLGIELFDSFFLAFMNSYNDMSEEVGVNIRKMIVGEEQLKDTTVKFHQFNQEEKDTIQQIPEDLDRLVYAASIVTALMVNNIGVDYQTQILSPLDTLENVKGSKSTAFHRDVEHCSDRKGNPEALTKTIISVLNKQNLDNSLMEMDNRFDKYDVGRTRRTGTSEQLFEAECKRFKSTLIAIASRVRGSVTPSLYDTPCTAFFRLQPKVSMRGCPPLQQIKNYYDNFINDVENNQEVKKLIDKWDQLCTEVKTCIKDVFGIDKFQSWVEKEYIMPDFNFNSYNSEWIYDNMNMLLELGEEQLLKFTTIFEAQIKVRTIWAYPLEVLMQQMQFVSPIIKRNAEFIKETTLNKKTYGVAHIATGLTKTDWGNKIHSMMKDYNIGENINGFNASDTAPKLTHQGDGVAYDQHYVQWNILTLFIVLMSTTNVRDINGKLTNILCDYTLLELALYECFSPVITPFHTRRVINAMLASGSMLTLLLNNISNCAQCEYCMINLSKMTISVMNNDMFFNGDNFLLTVGVYIDKRKVLLYDYKQFCDMYALFGHELNTLEDLIVQNAPNDKIEFSSYFFKIFSMTSGDYMLPFRYPVQLALGACVSERFENIRKFGDDYSNTMFNRAVSISNDLAFGAMTLWRWIYRYEATFNWLLSRLIDGDTSARKVKLMIIDTSNTMIETIINFGEYVSGRRLFEKISNMALSERALIYGTPHANPNRGTAANELKPECIKTFEIDESNNTAKIKIMNTVSEQMIGYNGEPAVRKVSFDYFKLQDNFQVNTQSITYGKVMRSFNYVLAGKRKYRDMYGMVKSDCDETQFANLSKDKEMMETLTSFRVINRVQYLVDRYIRDERFYRYNDTIELRIKKFTEDESLINKEDFSFFD